MHSEITKDKFTLAQKLRNADAAIHQARHRYESPPSHNRKPYAYLLKHIHSVLPSTRTRRYRRERDLTGWAVHGFAVVGISASRGVACVPQPLHRGVYTSSSVVRSDTSARRPLARESVFFRLSGRILLTKITCMK